MLRIRIRTVAVSLAVFDFILLLVGRLSVQLANWSTSTTLFKDLLGVSATISVIILLQCLGTGLLEKRLARTKAHYAAITSFSLLATTSVSIFLILPFMGFSLVSNVLVAWLTWALLVLGTPATSLVVALWLLNKLRPNDRGVGSVSDAVFYRGRSLLFIRNNRNVALCILKLASQSISSTGSNGGIQNAYSSQAEQNGRSKEHFPSYSHLTSLWTNVPDFGAEYAIENGLISVKFFTSSVDSDAQHAAKSAEEKAEKLKSVLQARFHTRIEFIQGHAARVAYRSVIGIDPCCNREIFRDCLKLKSVQEADQRCITVSVLKDKIKSNLAVDAPQEQAERFMSVFAKQGLTASMVIRLEATNPPSLSTEAKLVDKARNKPDMRVLLELDEKKTEVNEERQAQLSGFWKISAYVVYRGRSLEEVKLLQEKGDACLEAICSSERSRVECKKLKGKQITARLNDILFRRGVGVVMMNASSRLASGFLDLPEQHIPGIPEITAPVFEVPPKEELEDGEIPIGTVMSGDNEICPLRIKLNDLMLHTVIFGETGFGKTRLIMRVLQAISDYDVPWTLIEMKGEYKPLVKLIDKVVCFRPASDIAPLRVNLFDPQMENPETHAKKIFTVLKETFSTLFTDQNRDLSAQMERVFYEALVTYVTSVAIGCAEQTDDEKQGSSAERFGHQGNTRCWTAFNKWLATYADKNGLSSMPQINSTIQALLNRLNSFARAPLSEIFDNTESNVNFNDLVRRRAIIDLSEVKTKGTPEDIRLISNIITKYVATAAQQRGIQQELKHLLVIDDALDIVPEILTKRTTAETTITEQMILLLRTTGQGVIISTQRPNISQNIMANAATKIFLRTTVDSEKAEKWLNLDEDQASYLKIIPRREAIITTSRHSKPLRIKTLDIDLPNAGNKDIVMNNMINYPIIYDKGAATQAHHIGANRVLHHKPTVAKAAFPGLNRLKNVAEEARRAGDYKEALRTYVKAIEIMKEQRTREGGRNEDSFSPGFSFQRDTIGRPQTRPCQPFPTEAITLSPRPQKSLTIQRLQQEPQRTRTQIQVNTMPPPPDDKQTWLRVKQAFRHQQEIVEETTLQARLGKRTLQELRETVEPLFDRNLVGAVVVPSYTDSQTTTRIYYLTTDHESRNILQEYIMAIIHRDLQSKGINTRWIDQNMELLITSDNQHVITTWTNSNIHADTTIAKLTRIRQELEHEQTRELIIITPWRKDAVKLETLLTHLKLQGVSAIPFDENQTNRLVNHITIGNQCQT